MGLSETWPKTKPYSLQFGCVGDSLETQVPTGNCWISVVAGGEDGIERKGARACLSDCRRDCVVRFGIVGAGLVVVGGVGLVARQTGVVIVVGGVTGWCLA